MTVIDASVMVSALGPGDVFQQVSRAWLDRQIEEDRPLAAPYLMLSELAGAIARVTGDPADGHAAVAFVLAIPSFELIPDVGEPPTLATQLAADLQLKGADATYVAVAVQLEMDLRTWDREQLERGAAVVTTHRPSLPLPNGS